MIFRRQNLIMGLALIMLFIGVFSVSGQSTNQLPRRLFWQGSALSFDESGRLKDVLNSHGGFTSFGFDETDHVAWRINAENKQTEYGYDKQNRLTAITYLNGITDCAQKIIHFAYG